MDIIICGGGEIGGSTADAMVQRGHNVTVIDTDDERLAFLEEHFDIACVHGSASSAQALRMAGADSADAVIASTQFDEVNLVCATLAASLGAGRTLARVNHSVFLGSESVDYATLFSVDRLFSPDLATGKLLAARLRNPGAYAVERFARGSVELQLYEVSRSSPVIDKRLRELTMPAGSRVVALRRGDDVRLPRADSRLKCGDHIGVVVNADHGDELDGLFTRHHHRLRDIAIIGGSPVAVWTCRSLRQRGTRLRLFETDRERAEDLAEKLDWVSVIHADITEQDVFADQGLANADALLALADDNHNMLACAIAHQNNLPMVMALAHRPGLEQLLELIGVHEVLSPQKVALEDIIHFISDSDLEHVTSIHRGKLELFRVRVSETSPLAGRPLRELGPESGLVVAVTEDDSERGHVPGPDDVLQAGRHILVVCETDAEAQVRSLFGRRT